jgi:PAS domain S-box-containing protein
VTSSAQKLLGRLGFSGQLGLIVAFFAATIGCLVAMVAVALHTMSGMRAYVGGEGLWSKAEKAAVRALEHAAEGDRQALVYFDAVIDVPLGDRHARRELERATPDPTRVTAGFVAGRNHPADVPAMAMIVRRLRPTPQVARAIGIWTHADREIVRLEAVAARIRAILAAGPPSPVVTARLRRKIALVDARVTPLEDAFSATLSDSARLIATISMTATTLTAALLLGLGIVLSRLVLRVVREGAELQERADAALRESEERYRELFDNATDLVYSHDLQGTILSVNETCLRTTGWRRADVVGKSIATILTPESLAQAHQMIARKVEGGGSTVHELEILARDGRRIPIEVSTRLVVEADRPVVVHGIARDISERRHAAQVLAVEARIAGALARVGHDLMSSLDTPVLFDRLCQATSSVLGGVASVIALWDVDTGRYERTAASGAERPDADDLLARLGVPGGAFEEDGVVMMGPSMLAIALRRGPEVVGAQLVWTAGTIAPEDRRIAAGVAVTVSLALANADLVSRLEEASRLRSEFVSTMSHELRTPLNVMLGYTEMLRDETDEEARWGLLARMEASGRDLLELIESTLDLGRIEAGRDAVSFEPTSLRTLLLAVGGSCARFPRRSGVVLRWPQDPPDCRLHTDPRKLTVVLRNLVGNALKFTECGFVALEAELTDDGVVLRVRDTGIGIRPEDHERVFDMFRQADGSETRRFGGTGLGLYIVRRFVRQLRGTVTLESEPGRGSIFTVRLPRDADRRVANAA